MTLPIVPGVAWALIPARGGSKSIPRKNLLNVGGKPLIEHSIAHGLSCPAIQRTIVSTDDAEIAEVARRAGAEVPFERPAVYATDEATDLSVFQHALGWFLANERQLPEVWVHLRPTGPVREVTHLSQAVLQLLAEPGADALRSVHQVHESPYKMWRLEMGLLQPLLRLAGIPDAHSVARQRLPSVYLQNGYVDVIRSRTILEMGSICGRKILPFVTTGPVPDLDFIEQIPAVQRAVEATARTESSHEHSPCASSE